MHFISIYSGFMDSTSATSSRRSSFSEQSLSSKAFQTAKQSYSFYSCIEPREPNPKYKRTFTNNPYLTPQNRLKINTHVLDDLTAKTKAAFERSYLFQPGKQKQDQHFNQTFCGLYRAYRGDENLVDKVSSDLAKALSNYGDVSETTYYTEDALDANVEVTKHFPTECLINELKDILESKYGLQEELLQAFQSNGKKLNEDRKLQDRDVWITKFTHHVKESAEEPFDRGVTSPIFCLPFQALATAFPRTVEALQEILENILKSEWLKKDIAGVKTYLNEHMEVDRPIGDIAKLEQAIALWTTAKYQADKEKLKDKKHWENVKDEALGVAISGGLSYATANPSLIICKLSQFTVNRIADKSDPHGQDKGIQALKALAGAGLSGVMGGNPWDLGAMLGVDLLDLATEDPTKERSAIRGLGNAILKGVLTEDKKKLITHFLCGATAEVARKLPENDENTPLDVRILRALLSNSDVHAYYVGQWVDQRFKAPPKPKTDGILTPEEQAKFPTQQPTDLDLKIKKARDELIQKEAGVENAFIYLDDKQDDYDRNYNKDKYHKKLKGGIKNYNNALAERDATFNKLAELYGSADRLNTKPIKTPKRAGKWEKTKLWINSNVAGSGEMPVGNIPLYETKAPNRLDRSIPQYQGQERPKPTLDTPQKPTTQYSANMGQWEGIQEQKTQQTFNLNMAYRSPSEEPQLEPRLLQSGLAPSNKDALAMTGALPFAVSKLVPKETKTKIKTCIKNYCEQTVQELKADPLKAQKDQYVAMILGAKKGIVVMIQAFEQPSLKQNPHGFGLEELSNRCDHWVAGKLNVDLGSNHAKLGMFVGECFAPMGMLSEAKATAKTGQEAIHFLKAIKKHSPLADRALINSQEFGNRAKGFGQFLKNGFNINEFQWEQKLAFNGNFTKNVKAIEGIQQPIYRSGVAEGKAIQQAKKSVNMPSWKKIDIWMKHILSGHTGKGWRTGCAGNNKTLFPDGFSEKQVEKVVRQAYRYGRKFKTQNSTTVVVRGEYQGLKIEMYVNTEKKIIETAYPIK
jgi:hypothetical protein